MFLKQLFLVIHTVGFTLYAMEADLSLATPLVQRALEKNLLAAHEQPSDRSFELVRLASDKIREANFEEALKIMLSALEEFPHDVAVQIRFASDLGEYADSFSGLIREKMINRSNDIFRKLKEELREQPKPVEFFFRNEYCWRLGDYKSQYELGLERVNYYKGTPEQKRKGYHGYYSQGVGAANYARELLKAGNKEQAIEYAQKALIAWGQFLSHDNTYYKAHVHYALALGILGHQDTMIEALTRGADLVGRDLSYHVFRRVIDFVEDLDSH